MPSYTLMILTWLATLAHARINVFPCDRSPQALIDEYRVVNAMRPSVIESGTPPHMNLTFTYSIHANSHHYKFIRPWRFEVTFQNHLFKTFSQSSLNWTETQLGVFSSTGDSLIYGHSLHFDKIRAELTTMATSDGPSLILECWHWLNR